MNQTDLERFQATCSHPAYCGWAKRIDGGAVIYYRTCHTCMSVERTSETPADYKEPIIAPPGEVVLKDKMSFIIQLATALVKQRPGTQVCYVAGKVSGLPDDVVRNKFGRKKRELQMNGYIVLSPTDFIGLNENWQLAMRMALPLLMMSDVICMLPCWEDSPGAKVEFELATQMGIPAIFA